jgi:hypothetical protein
MVSGVGTQSTTATGQIEQEKRRIGENLFSYSPVA